MKWNLKLNVYNIGQLKTNDDYLTDWVLSCYYIDYIQKNDFKKISLLRKLEKKVHCFNSSYLSPKALQDDYSNSQVLPFWLNKPPKELWS